MNSECQWTQQRSNFWHLNITLEPKELKADKEVVNYRARAGKKKSNIKCPEHPHKPKVRKFKKDPMLTDTRDAIKEQPVAKPEAIQPKKLIIILLSYIPENKVRICESVQIHNWVSTCSISSMRKYPYSTKISDRKEIILPYRCFLTSKCCKN